MGRKRKVYSLNKRWMDCECGRSVLVYDDAVKSVRCEYCTMGVTIITNSKSDIERVIKAAEFAKENPPEKKKRGRPRKNPEQVKVKKPKGKRGRKSTIGTEVVNFIKKKKKVKFDKVVDFYMSERKKIGKKETRVNEEKNCYSMLYMLCRNNKIERIGKKDYKVS